MTGVPGGVRGGQRQPPARRMASPWVHLPHPTHECHPTHENRGGLLMDALIPALKHSAHYFAITNFGFAHAEKNVRTRTKTLHLTVVGTTARRLSKVWGAKGRGSVPIAFGLNPVLPWLAIRPGVCGRRKAYDHWPGTRSARHSILYAHGPSAVHAPQA